jgi:hypothetical protein
MSKVVIQGHASGTGDFTIAAPNSNTDRTLTLPDEAGTVLTTAGVPSNAMPAGSVLQVTYDSTARPKFSASVSTLTDTGFEVSITPKFANSKIKIDFAASVLSSAHYVAMDIYRNGTTGLSGDSANGLTGSVAYYTAFWQNVSMFIIDAPNTTSTVTYNIFAKTYSGTVTIGGAGVGASSTVYPNCVSLSATEIAQ